MFGSFATLSSPESESRLAIVTGMTLPIAVWLAVCLAGAALCIRSLAVLRGSAPATLLGWLASLAYFLLAGIAAARRVPAPAIADGIALATLTIAFVVAGVRDEPQAEPWWWPRRVGPTGAQRRARGKPGSDDTL